MCILSIRINSTKLLNYTKQILLEMFILVPFHPPCKDFSTKSLFRCVRGGFVWLKPNFHPIYTQYSSEGFSAYTQYEIGEFLRILSIV